jgi:hypothetical protein
VVVTSLRLIGYWGGDWPEVGDFVDPDWNEDERDAVSQYLAGGTMARVFMGYSACRFCGAQNGYAEFTDGTYIWPTGLQHYVDAHHVRLPREFVDHAVKRLRELEVADVDASWWRSRPIL